MQPHPSPALPGPPPRTLLSACGVTPEGAKASRTTPTRRAPAGRCAWVLRVGGGRMWRGRCALLAADRCCSHAPRMRAACMRRQLFNSSVSPLTRLATDSGSSAVAPKGRCGRRSSTAPSPEPGSATASPAGGGVVDGGGGTLRRLQPGRQAPAAAAEASWARAEGACSGASAARDHVLAAGAPPRGASGRPHAPHGFSAAGVPCASALKPRRPASDASDQAAVPPLPLQLPVSAAIMMTDL